MDEYAIWKKHEIDVPVDYLYSYDNRDYLIKNSVKWKILEMNYCEERVKAEIYWLFLKPLFKAINNVLIRFTINNNPLKPLTIKKSIRCKYEFISNERIK